MVPFYFLDRPQHSYRFGSRYPRSGYTRPAVNHINNQIKQMPYELKSKVVKTKNLLSNVLLTLWHLCSVFRTSFATYTLSVADNFFPKVQQNFTRLRKNKRTVPHTLQWKTCTSCRSCSSMRFGSVYSDVPRFARYRFRNAPLFCKRFYALIHPTSILIMFHLRLSLSPSKHWLLYIPTGFNIKGF